MKLTKTHGILFGIGVMGLSTLFGTGTTPAAQADPTIQNVQWRRDDRRDNRRQNRRIRRQAQTNTYTGRVTRDLDGNDFMMQADNGGTFKVIALRGEPGRLNRRDRVQVTGYFNDRQVFQAERVVILRNR
jgi:hypothetical protein